MKLIESYILKKCAFNSLLMLISFTLLFSIFNALAEFSTIGKGDFNSLSLLIYTVALVPGYIYLFMPLAVLIGVMLSMLSLVNYSEYAIIRTSGISLYRITACLLIFGLSMSLITFLEGEFVAPSSKQFAQSYKLSKTKTTMSTQLQSGIWSRDGENDFVNISQILPDKTILGVSIYKYDKDLKLKHYIKAKSGKFNMNQQTWELNDVTLYDYAGQNMNISYLQNFLWVTSIMPGYFSVLVVNPEDMSIIALLKYIQHLRQINQASDRYQIALWNKLLYPLSCVSMSLLAIAFIPNNRRNINLATKLFVGILIGIGFFFFTRLVSFLALLFNWNPVIAAIGPTLLLFALGWYFVLYKE